MLNGTPNTPRECALSVTTDTTGTPEPTPPAVTDSDRLCDACEAAPATHTLPTAAVCDECYRMAEAMAQAVTRRLFGTGE